MLERGRRGCKRPGCLPGATVPHGAWRDRVCRTALQWAVASSNSTSLGRPCGAHPSSPHSVSSPHEGWGGTTSTLWCLRRTRWSAQGGPPVLAQKS